MTTSSLEALRRFYAEEVCAVANAHTAGLEDALATVPREEFLGPGPWSIARSDGRRPGAMIYQATPDADPRHLYHNLLVAIDAARELNNGHPSTLISYLDALNLSEGRSFLHVGCGTGYYTAIAATLLGPSGRVVAAELDPDLALRARRNLQGFPRVCVESRDGSTPGSGRFDAILVNAGFTHPLAAWLDALEPSGILLVPITAAIPGSPITVGGMLRVARGETGWPAWFLTTVAIFASPTARAAALNDVIRNALATGAWLQVRSLRRDLHEPSDTCRVHHPGACLSSESPETGVTV